MNSLPKSVYVSNMLLNKNQPTSQKKKKINLYNEIVFEKKKKRYFNVKLSFSYSSILINLYINYKKIG